MEQIKIDVVKQWLINQKAFSPLEVIEALEKENAELTKMIDVSFALFLPRSLEMLACSQCEYDDFGYCRIDKRDNVDYKHCKECYRKALLKHS